MSSKHARLAVAVAAAVILGSTGAASVALASGGSVTPVPGLSSLEGIACPTTKSCVTVGSDDNFNGKSATIAAATGGVKAWSGTLENDSMNAVACASKTSCLAVSDDAVATVAVSSGAMKATVTPKKPKNGIVALGNIACAGAKRCYAVGFKGTEANSIAIVLTLSPAGKLLSTKKDKGTGVGNITCPSSTLCLLSDASHSGVAIQLLKSGKFGSSHPLPAHTYDQSLSCYEAKLCYALGGNSTSTVSKTDELFPVNPKTGELGSETTIHHDFGGYHMTCISATTCLVSGFTGSGSTAKPAIVTVVHGKPGAPVNYPATNGDNFHAVGCASPSECYAVGSSSSGAIVEKVKS